jgi:hypothetical protein
MVLTEQAEAAVTDANEKYLQDGGKDTQVLESIGPLPPLVLDRLVSITSVCRVRYFMKLRSPAKLKDQMEWQC